MKRGRCDREALFRACRLRDRAPAIAALMAVRVGLDSDPDPPPPPPQDRFSFAVAKLTEYFLSDISVRSGSAHVSASHGRTPGTPNHHPPAHARALSAERSLPMPAAFPRRPSIRLRRRDGRGFLQLGGALLLSVAAAVGGGCSNGTASGGTAGSTGAAGDGASGTAGTGGGAAGT